VARVREVIAETPRVKTLKLDVPGWPGHLPGQRVDIRLTAEDGYQAQRSYSIASPSEEDGVALTVELVPDGEVSDYLVNEVRPEDKFGIRGPFGGHFIWTVAKGGPLFLIAGGSAEELIKRLADGSPGGGATEGAEAIRCLATLVGAVVIASAAGQGTLREEILAVCKPDLSGLTGGKLD
jgi:hypothetical protein